MLVVGNMLYFIVMMCNNYNYVFVSVKYVVKKSKHLKNVKSINVKPKNAKPINVKSINVKA